MDTNRPLLRQLQRSDAEGFGLVEVVIAMFILSAVAIGILPALASGMKQSVTNQTVSSATQLVDTRIDLARSQGATCSAVRALIGTSTSVDSRGISLTTTTTATGAVTPATVCPVVPTPAPTPASTAYPTTVTLVVVVTRTATGATVARASTLVYVNAQ
jgi:type II secretory pathway pseudopilin PulG